MTEHWQQNRGALAVMIAAGCLSGGMGSLGGLPYGSSGPGAIIGVVTGVAAGWWWSRHMLPRLQAGQLQHPGSTGGLYGMLAGAVTALVLHALLPLISGKFYPGWLFTGAICGVVTGFVLGEICARIARAVVSRTPPQDTQ